MNETHPGVPGTRRRKTEQMGLLRRIETVTPLLIIPVIIYGVMSLLAGSDHGPDGPAILGMLNSTLISMPMISGVRWILTAGDALLVLSLIVLSIEIMKSTSTRSSAMINHVASMFVLLFCIVMFLLVGNFATGVFFLLTLITLMDVLVGVIVSIVSARRDFGVGDGFAG